MSQKCPQCKASVFQKRSYGYFVRSSDKKYIQRFRCFSCNHIFSKATFQKCYRQKKRGLNSKILELFCSGVSQRRIAKHLKINRKTVARRLIFLATHARIRNRKKYNELPPVEKLQFDDLETIEHTKCKPLSVTLAVEKETRRILGFRVSQMPAKGHLVRISLKKYGYRADHRAQGRCELFKEISHRIHPKALIETDQNPHYLEDVKRFFPQATHKTYLSKRAAIAGQGELKKVAYDPIFSINHTFAMLRANINRLFRKTWCTTKLPARLSDHIELYVYYHNEKLLKPA
jgi:transposase-like protein